MRTLAILAFAMMLVPFAAADSYSGSILVGHPTTGFIGGVTELAEPCNTAAVTTGVDGVWFDLQDDTGTAFLLTMDATLDADVWFYSSTCDLISFSGGALEGLGADESGNLPGGAAFAVVDGYMGTGDFTLTVS